MSRVGQQHQGAGADQQDRQQRDPKAGVLAPTPAACQRRVPRRGLRWLARRSDRRIGEPSKPNASRSERVR
jgi:hypothetical protein